MVMAAARSPWELLLLAAGALAVARALAVLAVLVFRRVRSIAPPSAVWIPLVGRWAVVTGASAGIGAAFARRLAARGLHVVLIARNRDRLEEVARACSSSIASASNNKMKKVQTRVVVFDFATATESDYERLAGELRELDPAVLVNNVGVNVPYPTRFVDTDPDLVDTMVRVNIGATNRMTRMLLPGMLAAKRGAVLCLSSAGGAIAPAPLLAVYAATKAYNDAFAVALAGEARDFDVTVHSLVPFFVETAMAKMRSSFTVPTADQFADKALAALGGPVRLNPHWPHALMASLLLLLPLKLQIEYVAHLHRDIRKRALRRAERLASASTVSAKSE